MGYITNLLGIFMEPKYNILQQISSAIRKNRSKNIYSIGNVWKFVWKFDKVSIKVDEAKALFKVAARIDKGNPSKIDYVEI